MPQPDSNPLGLTAEQKPLTKKEILTFVGMASPVTALAVVLAYFAWPTSEPVAPAVPEPTTINLKLQPLTSAWAEACLDNLNVKLAGAPSKQGPNRARNDNCDIRKLTDETIVTASNSLSTIVTDAFRAQNIFVQTNPGTSISMGYGALGYSITYLTYEYRDPNKQYRTFEVEIDSKGKIVGQTDSGYDNNMERVDKRPLPLGDDQAEAFRLIGQTYQARQAVLRQAGVTPPQP